jgi:hypothetical protein
MLLDSLLTRSPASLSQVPAIPAAAEAAAGCSRNDKEVIRSIHPSGWAAAAMRRGAAGGPPARTCMTIMHVAQACAKVFAPIIPTAFAALPSICPLPHNCPEAIMAKKSRLVATTVSPLGAALLLTGCVSAPGTYPSSYGPRNGAGFLVDPQTGLELPGQPDIGGPGN